MDKDMAPVEDDSETETFYCAICMEFLPMHRRFRIHCCPHYFCFSCIIEHINYRVFGGDIPVRCPEPGCTIGEVTYEAWSKHIEDDVHEAWLDAISRENADFGALREGQRCSDCGQFFAGIPTEEIDGTIDTKTMHELVVMHGRHRCPSCRYLIENNGGCSLMTCRCGSEFCYSCGKILFQKEEPTVDNEENPQTAKVAANVQGPTGNEQGELRNVKKNEEKRSRLQSQIDTGTDTKRDEKIKKRIIGGCGSSSSENSKD